MYPLNANNQYIPGKCENNLILRQNTLFPLSRVFKVSGYVVHIYNHGKNLSGWNTGAAKICTAKFVYGGSSVRPNFDAAKLPLIEISHCEIPLIGILSGGHRLQYM